MTTSGAAPTVDDAVASHVSWMTALAGLPGGATWTDGPLRWAYDAPYGTLHALFPDRVCVDAARRGLDRAQEHGAAHVAIWSAVDVARPELLDVGFEVGWQPWWMGVATADLDDGPVRLARRVGASLRAGVREAARQPLLARADTWRAEARVDGHRVGRAWGHRSGAVAGLYDMAVGRRHRRQGLGRELVATVAAEAARRGADRLVLNATPDGERLYTACGFVRLGEGRTWWWHAPPR